MLMCSRGAAVGVLTAVRVVVVVCMPAGRRGGIRAFLMVMMSAVAVAAVGLLVMAEAVLVHSVEQAGEPPIEGLDGPVHRRGGHASFGCRNSEPQSLGPVILCGRGLAYADE